MKAVMIPRFGGPEVLEIGERPMPDPEAGQVRIRVGAATVNRTDTSLRSGRRRTQLPFPYTPGMEAAGTIDALGAEVKDRRIGEEVLAIVLPQRPQGGAQAEWVAVPADSVAPIPAGASLEEAATLPMNGLTAQRALDLLDLAPGATLAVTGAAGAVGGYVIQLAKVAGLTVLADAGPSDRELVQRLGADIVVKRGQGVAGAIRAAMPQGADGLVDAAAQGEAVLGAVRDHGRVAAVRTWEGGSERGIRVLHVDVTDYARNQSALQRLVHLTEAGRVTLRVADTYPMERVADAHRRLEAGGVRGRLVLRF